MKALAGVGALVAVTLGLSAWLAGPRATAAHAAGPPSWPQPTSSSRLVHGGRVRCTATVRSAVQVGQTITVNVAIRNVSKHAVTLSRGVGSTGFVLRTADDTAYDSGALYQGLPVPPPAPTKLRAGATIHEGLDVTARWRGPFQITPECLDKTLPALRVRVVAAWPGPEQSTAVAQVVAAAGHLLDHCRPQTSGVAVAGQIDPPSGTAPPLEAQCSVTISPDGPFLIAQVLVVTPGLAGVQIFQPYETLWQSSPLEGPPPAAPPYEEIAWEFVVTREKATPVAAASVAATKQSSSGTAPSFDWDGSGWQSGGLGSCGGTAFAWGGTGPEIEFISACPA